MGSKTFFTLAMKAFEKCSIIFNYGATNIRFYSCYKNLKTYDCKTKKMFYTIFSQIKIKILKDFFFASILIKNISLYYLNKYISVNRQKLIQNLIKRVNQLLCYN